MDAVHKSAGFVLRRTRGKFCHTTVGKEHQVLNKLVTLAMGYDIKGERFAVGIQFTAQLGIVNGNRSRIKLFFLQCSRDTRECAKHLIPWPTISIHDLLCFFISEPCGRADNASAKPFLGDSAVLADFKHCRVAEPLLVWQERAECIRERLGEHGDDAVNEVDRRCALMRLLIQGAPGADKERYVGDVY